MRGNKIHSSKLTINDVIEIRKNFCEFEHINYKNAYNGRIVTKDIAFCSKFYTKYNVTKICLLNIVRNKSWNFQTIDRIYNV